MGDESDGSRSLSRVSERWRETPWNEAVRPCVPACADRTGGKAGRSPVSDVGVNCILSGRFRRGGGGRTEDEDVTDLERATRGEEGVDDWESFTLGSVDVDGRRCGCLGGGTGPEPGTAGKPEQSMCVVDTPGAWVSRLGSGGLGGAAIGDESVAPATCSSDKAELDVDDCRLDFRRRGRGGTHVASSDPPDPDSGPYPLGSFCLEGLRLRVFTMEVMLLAEELDDVLRTCRTRSRSSCSSARFIDCACLLASSDCLIRGLTWVGFIGIRGGPECVTRLTVDVLGVRMTSEGRRGGAASNAGLRGGNGGSLP